MKAKLIILTPVFNDWKNLDKLLTKINKLFHYKIKQKFDLIIVDDNSTEKIIFLKSKFRKINNVKILKNSSNLGSQRSIAIGLMYIKKIYNKNYNLIVIDSDGQDNPLGITKLIEKFNQNNCCVVARRGQRKESNWFKFFYEVYCFLILILSLKKIRFGNFSLLSFKDVSKIEKNNLNIVTVDKDKLIFPVVLRYFNHGDYFFPYGMNGSKKVGKFLKDNNIGEIDKSSKLILVNGDDKIIWVVGMRLDDRFSINNETKNLLNIEYHK